MFTNFQTLPNDIENPLTSWEIPREWTQTEHTIVGAASHNLLDEPIIFTLLTNNVNPESPKTLSEIREIGETYYTLLQGRLASEQTNRVLQRAQGKFSERERILRKVFNRLTADIRKAQLFKNTSILFTNEGSLNRLSEYRARMGVVTYWAYPKPDSEVVQRRLEDRSDDDGDLEEGDKDDEDEDGDEDGDGNGDGNGDRDVDGDEEKELSEVENMVEADHGSTP